MLFEQFDFPIYALNTMDTRNTMSYASVMQAVNRNRDKGYRDYPLKSLQFHSFMWGAQDTGACLRKGQRSEYFPLLQLVTVGYTDLLGVVEAAVHILLFFLDENRMVHASRRSFRLVYPLD